ncbi:MAG: hypothetical protein L3K03_00530 [Thermoplasmata archaeon]|nr:hypothetical protein [Thermoplasmata archaeon]
MKRLRTIRQRPNRATAAQVSAVATILGLLLLSSFLGNFFNTTLPAEEEELEFQHGVLIQNQMAELQATIYKEASSPLPYNLPTPISLGSEPYPPFGLSSPGSIAPAGPGTSVNSTYTLVSIDGNSPDWNFGSHCLSPAGSGTCITPGVTNSWNSTANGTRFNVIIAASASTNGLYYNITGQNDSLNVTWLGATAGRVEVVIYGSNDTVNFTMSGLDANSPILQFLFYGQNDTINSYITTVHIGVGGTSDLVQFVGVHEPLCPQLNLSGTDRLGHTNVTGLNSNVKFTVSWWNAIGRTTAPNTLPLAGGGSSVTFLNNTGFIACAFTKAYPEKYLIQYESGILVHLNNRYDPPTDIAYDDGAVILAHPGLGSILLDQPNLFVRPINSQAAMIVNGAGGPVSVSGFDANFTLVSLFGNYSQEVGVGTASVLTRVIDSHTYSVINLPPKNIYLASFWLNVTTPYPSAWSSLFSTWPGAAIPGGFHCTTTVVIAAPYTCLLPPPGDSVTLSGEMLISELNLQTVTVAVSIA